MSVRPARQPHGEGALTCPSRDCASGNLLIGVVRADGTVARMHPPTEIDDRFVDRACHASSRPAEARFRFSGPCVTGACENWTGTRCGVSDAITAAVSPECLPLQPLPRCEIRPTCRWWSQNGTAACRMCSLIVHTPPDHARGSLRDPQPTTLRQFPVPSKERSDHED